jgi:hypothetical protein
MGILVFVREVMTKAQTKSRAIPRQDSSAVIQFFGSISCQMTRKRTALPVPA